MHLFLISILFGTLGCATEGSLIGKFVSEKEIEGSKLNVLHKPSTVSFARNQKPVAINEITSIISLALGFSVPKEIQWRGLLSGNPFSRPNAALMFTVDSVPLDEDVKITSSYQVPVKMDAGSSRVEALSLSPKKTLSSHISEIYNEKSRTVSLSASEELAAAGYCDGERSQTVFWNEKMNAWINVNADHPKGETLFTKPQLQREMETIFNSEGLKYHSSKNSLVVSMKNADVSFDLDKKADFLFFGELAMTQLLYNKIASKSELIKDGVPDVYMFGITGLKHLQKKYGSNSIQVKAAIQVLEKFIPEITQKFVKLYSGNILAVALTLKKNEVSAPDDTKNTKILFDQVKEHLGKQSFNQFQEKFPELHVFDEMVKHTKKSLCEQMAGLVSSFGLEMKFKCATDNEHHKVFRRSLLATKTQSSSLNLGSLYDPTFPVIFNMWFWLMVVLFLVVYVICLVMWYMDPGRDSIIYRMTNQRIRMD